MKMACTGSNHWVCNSLGWSEQGGLILLLSLAMLAGLSLLALLAASSMLQQQQMAANHADGELARLSAITAVGLGEHFVLELPDSVRTANCQSGCYAEPINTAILEAGSFPQNPEFLNDNWWSNFAETGQFGTLPGRQAPMFIIEELEFSAAEEAASGDSKGLSGGEAEDPPEINGVAYYRILGRGTGVAAGSTHVAESILARPWRSLPSPGESPGVDCSAIRPWYDCGRMAYRERR